MAIIRNSVFASLGSLVPFAVTIITLPLLIRAIGMEAYGVLAISWLILVYVGQADFGLSRAVSHRIAALRADVEGTEANIAGTARTAVALGAAAGLMTGFCAAIIAAIYFRLFFEADTIGIETLAVPAIIGAATALVTMLGVFFGLLIGEERFREMAAIVMTVNSLQQLLPLAVALLWSTDIAALLAATLLARLTGVVWAAGKTARLTQQAAPISMTVARALTGYGKWVMAATVTKPVLTVADRFIIGAQMGPVAVAAYAVPYQIASRTQMVPQAISNVLFPRFTALSEADAADAARLAVLAMAAVSAPFYIALTVLSAPALSLWLGQELDPRSLALARILLVAFWIAGLGLTASVFLQARNDPRFVALWTGLQIPLYIAALLVCGYLYGLIGIALAFLARTLLESGVLLMRAGLFDRALCLRVTPMALLLVAAAVIGGSATGWALVLWTAVLASVGLAVAVLALPATLRRRLTGILALRRR